MPANVSAIQRAQVWIKSKGVCHYCGVKMNYDGPRPGSAQQADTFTVDHKVPLSRGGNSSRKNLVGACRNCNHLKGKMTEAEFREKIKGGKVESL